MAAPALTMACQAYDRMQPLRDGTVRIAGVELNFLDLPVEETFFRMLSFAEFDIAELSLSSYVLTLGRDAPFVAVPVFPSRAFRHSGVYVREDSPLTDLAELAGTTVGVPEYQITAAVWIRGILAEHHGVPVASVRYRTGGLDTAGRVEKMRLDLPPDVDVEPVGAGETLSDLLLGGALDAVYSARNPGPFNRPDRGGLRRLLPDPVAAEREYHARTGIFPIMHTLVIRRNVYQQHRWLARELVKACATAKQLALAGIGETAALPYALPWLWAEVERTRLALGEDWWPYGLEPNRTTLSTFLRYSHEQGLATRRYEPEELFAPESLAEVVV
ncbi:ABC transporter substrate-binding protein [Blastococcus sp. CT_GayMR16]|uniref:ABC transporter substrate-binding protein n=1 Tax=Blastococcus sp. CT_GayMR16 TaxID=2559607 RepID=UPI001073030A|nr:ABC transporter substrate-binding protein [Blastococcus sp. CT_GayMR16]TFV85818.1 ABC transporter substrate-binding protein [Blastococcus sp. CT_GayMR16]